MAVVGTADTALLTFNFTFIVYRVDGLVGSIITVGPAEGFRFADLEQLAQIHVERLGGESQSRSPEPDPTEATSADVELVEALDDAFDDLPLELQQGLALGDPDAPVTIVQFEDFQCPFCLRYTAEREPFLVDEYVKAGLVRIEFRNFPILGRESALAAIAGVCAGGQNRFWEYANRLFTLQAEAGQSSNERLNVGRFAEDELLAVADDLGLDTDEFAECQASEEAIGVVDAHVRDGRQIGITGTPGFVINGRALAGGSPTTDEAWANLIDPLLD